MGNLLPWAIGFPALSAFVIGAGVLAGIVIGEPWEKTTARIALAGAALALLAGLAALATDAPEPLHLGNWLTSGDYRIGLDFSADRLSLGLSALFALLCLLVIKFSVNYMHREAGYHRFFFVLSLFAAAMQLLVTAGNGVLAFAGWEIAGLCSYLLIGYAYDRENAVANATRVFVVNRIGDAGFVAGLALSFLWLGGIEWDTINGGAAILGDGQRFALAVCFLTAAMAKSAQMPLATWLSRAIEGPTPSSAVFYGAVMVHAGVYLVLRLEPLFASSPGAMGLLLLMGVATAFYGFFAGLAQTDVKSALVFSSSGQLGLMFAECGLGLWQLAAWHLVAHAVLRGYQFLAAPSLMHDTLGLAMRQVPAWLARRRRWYTVALQRFWLDPLADWAVTDPTRRLASDLSRFDERVVNRLIGLPAPAIRALSSLAQWEERHIQEALGIPLRGGFQEALVIPLRGGFGAYDAASHMDAIRPPGLLGRWSQWLANGLHHFEERWVLYGMGEGMLRHVRRFGPGLNRLDDFMAQPRYMVLLILATLLTVL